MLVLLAQLCVSSCEPGALSGEEATTVDNHLAAPTDNVNTEFFSTAPQHQTSTKSTHNYVVGPRLEVTLKTIYDN